MQNQLCELLSSAVESCGEAIVPHLPKLTLLARTLLSSEETHSSGTVLVRRLLTSLTTVRLTEVLFRSFSSLSPKDYLIIVCKIGTRFKIDAMLSTVCLEEW